MLGPEFSRNVWLELTPRRMIFMSVLLALTFSACAVSGSLDISAASAAKWLFYLIVVVWGARNAALSVVGEIHDRTWDLQRLSSLSPGQMTWGKLFGATVYNWFGGAICLVILLAHALVRGGATAALIDAVYYVAIGVIAQAAALLASLVAVRRRQAHTRLEIFLYQLVGMTAALGVFYVWSAADPAGTFVTQRRPTDTIVWWTVAFDARPFLLVSLALFAAWMLVGCYREMRVELRMQNGPMVWIGFLVFMGSYVSGFDSGFDTGFAGERWTAQWDPASARLVLAALVFAGLTYAMIVLEPKEPVFYRWLGRTLASGGISTAFVRLQGWMTSYLAALGAAVALVAWQIVERGALGQHAALVVSAAGFLTRDVAIFVLYQTLPGRRRGDLAAIVTLAALYALLPAILEGLDLKNALPFFYARPTQPVWLGPAIAWTEAAIGGVAAFTRTTMKDTQPAPLPG